ncbi:MAG: hypothetical protein DI601_23905 [Azospirillum brasilense]|nr:MAG: hypothetical protein DI601_23905 [Azospirillum brasilense]
MTASKPAANSYTNTRDATPMTVRAQTIPARHYFPDHAHRWHQVVHAISGTLTVAVEGKGALPWPRSGSLGTVCEAIYADPADPRGPGAWGTELGMSGRALARRFEAELGMSFRSWRRRLRLFKAIELLGGGMDVTQTAIELGYGSSSAFIYAFRTDMGCGPQTYMRGRMMALVTR